MIQTIADCADEVQKRFLAFVDAPVDPDLLDELACLLVDGADALDFVIYGHACHSAARALYLSGSVDRANFFHSLGQELLDRAMTGIGFTIGQAIDAAGYTKH